MNRKTEQVGTLNRRVTIYQPTYVRNGLGAAVPTWSVLATTWADVMPHGGDEAQEADRTTAVKRLKFRIRAQSAPAISEEMVIRFKTEDYDISEIHDDPQQFPNTFFLITAERRRENLAG